MDGKFFFFFLNGKFFVFFFWMASFFVGKLKFKKTVIMYGKNI